MDQEKIKQVIAEAENKYKYIQENTVWIEQQRSDLLVINWHVYMDEFISEYRVKQIAKFLHDRLPGVKIYSATDKLY